MRFRLGVWDDGRTGRARTELVERGWLGELGGFELRGGKRRRLRIVERGPLQLELRGIEQQQLGEREWVGLR